MEKEPRINQELEQPIEPVDPLMDGLRRFTIQLDRLNHNIEAMPINKILELWEDSNILLGQFLGHNVNYEDRKEIKK